jgi:hypothetical protein
MKRNAKRKSEVRELKGANLARHRANCSVCAHEDSDEMDRDFVSWRSPAAIAVEYGLSDRRVVYRHAHALGLFAKRDRNVRAALARIIEKSGDVDVTAAAVVAAIQAYAKINAQGTWVDRAEHVNLNEMFDRMSKQELEKYARDGTLPDWFTQTVSVTSCNSEADENAE